jgi:ATP-dependent Clp protease adapter protein ClpS
MSSPVLDPTESDFSAKAGRWMVIMFDNPINTMDEVVDVLMLATGCDCEEATIEMWEAHLRGKAPVHFASAEECRKVAKTISRIGVQTEVAPEWND